MYGDLIDLLYVPLLSFQRHYQSKGQRERTAKWWWWNTLTKLVVIVQIWDTSFLPLLPHTHRHTIKANLLRQSENKREEENGWNYLT